MQLGGSGPCHTQLHPHIWHPGFWVHRRQPYFYLRSRRRVRAQKSSNTKSDGFKRTAHGGHAYFPSPRAHIVTLQGSSTPDLMVRKLPACSLQISAIKIEVRAYTAIWPDDQHQTERKPGNRLWNLWGPFRTMTQLYHHAHYCSM